MDDLMAQGPDISGLFTKEAVLDWETQHGGEL